MATPSAGSTASSRPAQELEEVLAYLRIDCRRGFARQEVALKVVRIVPRPFSHVARVSVSAPPSTEPFTHLYVKVFKPKADRTGEQMRARVAHEFDTTRRVYQHFSALDGFTAVRPIACYPERLALATEEVRGETLLGVLEREAAWFPPPERLQRLEQLLARVGNWVAAFQGIAPGDARVSLDELRAYIDLRLARLTARPKAKFHHADREAVLAHTDALWAQLDADDLQEVGVHADLAAGNVLVHGDRVAVIDFAMAHRGSRYHDLARLHLQLELLKAKPRFRQSTVAVLQGALLDGYRPGLTARNPLFRLMLLMHRVNNLSSLSARPFSFPSSLYDAHVRRLHRRWLADELRQRIGRPA